MRHLASIADAFCIISHAPPGYDAVGNMLTAVDDSDLATPESSSAYAFRYDRLNRMVESDNADGNEATQNVVLYYTYDAQGNVRKVWDDAGVAVRSEYNARNLLEQQLWYDASLGGAQGPMAVNALTGEADDVEAARVDYLYNAAGRMSQLDRYSGLEKLIVIPP